MNSYLSLLLSKLSWWTTTKGGMATSTNDYAGHMVFARQLLGAKTSLQMVSGPGQTNTQHTLSVTNSTLTLVSALVHELRMHAQVF